jgi:hypothetical protein
MSESDPSVVESRTGDAASSHQTPRAIVWVGLLAALAVWVAIDRISTYRGGGLRNTARVWDVWRTLRDDLPLPSVAVIALVLFTLSGCAWLLWLALATVDDAAPVRRPSAHRVGQSPPSSRFQSSSSPSYFGSTRGTMSPAKP